MNAAYGYGNPHFYDLTGYKLRPDRLDVIPGRSHDQTSSKRPSSTRNGACTLSGHGLDAASSPDS